MTDTKVPFEEVSVAQAMRAEPRVNPKISRAFKVEDGSVDGWQLVWSAANSAKLHGAQILTYHRVTKINRAGDRVSQVVCIDEKTGKRSGSTPVSCSTVPPPGAARSPTWRAAPTSRWCPAPAS